MRHQQVELQGETCNIFLLEPGDSAEGPLGVLNSNLRSGFDCETTGLRIYSEGYDVKLAQFGTRDLAFVYRPSDFPTLTRQLTTTRVLDYWNADHDRRSIDRVLGIKLEDTAPFFRDGQLGNKCVDPRSPKQGGIGHGLKEVASARLGVDVKDEKDALVAHCQKEYKDALRADMKRLKLPAKQAMWWTLPWDDEEYWKYAGIDIFLTVRTGEWVDEAAAHYDVSAYSIAQRHAVADVCSQMIRKGWQSDAGIVSKAIDKFTAELAVEESWLSTTGVRPTKASNSYHTSNRGLIDRFLELGVELVEPTDTAREKKWSAEKIREQKAYTLNDEVLSKIAKHNDEAAAIAQSVLRAKSASKSLSFMTSFDEFADAEGRVHAGLNPFGTVTGRMSCSQPNLQQATKDVPEVRGCFIADEGQVLISVDFSGVEWRVAAAVMNDANMLEAYRQGLDIHALVAEDLYGDDFRAATEAQQKVMRNGGAWKWEPTPLMIEWGLSDKLPSVKSIGLSILYGSGVEGSSKKTGLPEDVTEQVFSAIHNRYPGIRRAFRNAREEINGPTGIYFPTGRRSVIDMSYKKPNADCQGIASDLLCDAALRLHDAGYGPSLLMLVHDEFILSVSEAEADMHLARIIETVELTGKDAFMGLVEIKAEGHVLGRHWKKA